MAADLLRGQAPALRLFAEQNEATFLELVFRHFIEEAQGQAGSVYGRRMYEVMRYWDDDHPEWDAEEHAFGRRGGTSAKWVVALVEVGRPQRQASSGRIWRAQSAS